MHFPTKSVAIGIALAALQARSVVDGVYTDAQAVRGERSYASYCANCHGVELAGGDLAPSLVGSEFIAHWNGSSVGELFERIKTTMPQDSPDSLSRQQYADLLAFMLKKLDFPAGTSELPAAAAPLDAIRFPSSKP